MRLGERLRHLDNQVLGRPVPDNRPLWQRALRPRPAVWSLRGRISYGLVMAAMVALLFWEPGSLLRALAIVPVLAAAFLVIAADERKRARRHYGERDE